MKAIAPPPYQGETFLNGPKVDLSEVGEGDLVVIGIPWDKTKLSRRGCADGPKAIRDATHLFDYYVTKLADNQLIDINDRREFKYVSSIKDAGDLELDDLETEQMIKTVHESFREVGASGAVPVTLGGDHFTTFPVVWGLTDGLRERNRSNISYLHIDLHLDLCGEVPIFGKYSSGSTIRNLFEVGALRSGRAAVIGAEPVQMKSDIEFADENGLDIHSITEVERDGATKVTRGVLDRICEGSDGLYVSLDIDCLKRTYAPGTGNAMGISGLLPNELMEILDVAREYPICGFDIVEVSPAWDASERTQNIAASAAIEFLEPRLFEVAGGD